jgi:anoctamin-10/anoctamin-7
MKELQTTLGTIFITRLVVGNLTEVGVPYFMQKQKQKAESEGAVRELSEVEKNFIQDEYHVMMGPFNDYAEAAIQYGYTTMFVAAFPLAAFMSFVSNYIELRVDAWKLCQQSRRPEPRSAEDIGTWQSILELISLAAVLSNSAMVAYTGTYAVNNTWTERAWIFVGMSWGIIVLKYIISIVIPDEPEDVLIQLKRQDYIVSKVFDDAPDDDDESLVQNVGTKLDYTIRITDDDPL